MLLCASARPVCAAAGARARRRGRTATLACAPQHHQSSSAPALRARRGLLASALLGAAVLWASDSRAVESAVSGVDDTSSPLVQELLRRTAEKRESRVKERLDDYNRRNYSDYFAFSTGSAASDGELSPNDQAVRAWLESNAK